MAEIIRFDSGVKEYSLNNAVTVSFCPTDMTFIENVFNAVESMDKKQEKFQTLVQSVKNNADAFDVARSIDQELREEINAIFGLDVCTPLWGAGSVFALADGLPRWANLLFAVIDQLDGEFAEEKKKTNPRIAKYTKKYKR